MMESMWKSGYIFSHGYLACLSPQAPARNRKKPRPYPWEALGRLDSWDKMTPPLPPRWCPVQSPQISFKLRDTQDFQMSPEWE